jgi:excinuclease ABC subunit C
MYNNAEIEMDKHSEGFKLVTRVQDEVHRFAVEYHRKLRADTQVHSVLDEINGVGPARRKALMRHFKSIEAIREATEEELSGVDSMNSRSAKAVYNFFHEISG